MLGMEWCDFLNCLGASDLLMQLNVGPIMGSLGRHAWRTFALVGIQANRKVLCGKTNCMLWCGMSNTRSQNKWSFAFRIPAWRKQWCDCLDFWVSGTTNNSFIRTPVVCSMLAKQICVSLHMKSNEQPNWSPHDDGFDDTAPHCRSLINAASSHMQSHSSE